MPRRNRKPVNKMRCSHCHGRVPTAYAKTHIERCLRARDKRRAERSFKYNKGE